MRITRQDIENLLDLREKRKELERQEKRLRDRFKRAGLDAEHPIRRGDLEAALVPYDGSPDVKSAYIKLAGQRAYDRLPRPAWERLVIRTV